MYGTPNRKYKVYTALLTQTGTDAPTATVLENTLGGTVVWTRIAAGGYTATLASAFTADKTACLITNARTSDSTLKGVTLACWASDANSVKLYAYDITGNAADIDLSGGKISIEIRVYP